PRIQSKTALNQGRPSLPVLMEAVDPFALHRRTCPSPRRQLPAGPPSGLPIACCPNRKGTAMKKARPEPSTTAPLKIVVRGAERVFDIDDPKLPDWIENHKLTTG